VSPAERWLRDRVPDAPVPLMDAMVGALAADAGEAVPEALAAGALHLYRALLHGTGGREDALPLLAADALLTHALQAQAEEDVAGLAAFAERWGAAGRLGAMASGS
jgi:hypothetical protein